MVQQSTKKVLMQVLKSIKNKQINNAPVLVVAAHADDEVLGCGGTIARMVAVGREVHVLVLADGVSSRNIQLETNEFKQRFEEAQLANHLLGVTSLRICELPDNRMDGIDLLDIVRLIEERIQVVRPCTIFTHHYGDVNIDHRRTHEAVLVASRPQPSNCVKELLFFEVASSTEWRAAHSAIPFVPNFFVDISSELNDKLEALKVYKTELRQYPHPRSLAAVEALAHWRGSSVGLLAAEAFEVGRMIV